MNARVILPDAEQIEAYLELRAAWAADPELYVVQRLGMRPTWQQRKALEAIANEGAHVSIRSGHGTGKTGVMAGIVWWFMETRDYPKIPCTAPTSHQLRDVLWAELAKWQRKANQLSARRSDSPALWLGSMFRLTSDRIYDPSAKGEWFASARTSSKDNPDALQGFHAADVQISEDGTTAEHGEGGGQILFVVDEAAGVHDAVFQAAEGALSTPGARLLMAANPTRLTGYFADSQRHNRGEFTTLHFRSGDSPLVDPSYRAKLVRKWGEGSNVVRVRADGDFPKQDDDALISLEWAEAAIDRPAIRDPKADTRIGLDVARFGDDRTVFAVRRGNHVPHVKIAAKLDTMQVVGLAIAVHKEFGGTFYVDVGAMGAGVVDRLGELGYPVIAVNFGASAPTRKRHIKADKDRPGQAGEGSQARLIRDYIWLAMADAFQFEDMSLEGCDRDNAEDLAGEISAVKYKLHSDGSVMIEPKEETKKRLGFSPDIGDALACTYAPGAAGPRYATAGDRTF